MRAAILYAIDFLDFSGSAPFRDKKKRKRGRVLANLVRARLTFHPSKAEHGHPPSFIDAVEIQDFGTFLL
jgi:hypothetical protein